MCFTAVDLLKLFKELLYEVMSILRQVREGQVKMEIEHVGLESMRQTLNQIFNNVVEVNILYDGVT